MYQDFEFKQGERVMNFKVGQSLFVVMRADVKGSLKSFPFTVFPAVCEKVTDDIVRVAVNVYGEPVYKTYYWGEVDQYLFKGHAQAQRAADQRN